MSDSDSETTRDSRSNTSDDESGDESEDDLLSREFESLGLQDDLPLPIVPLGERATLQDYQKVSNCFSYSRRDC